MKLQFINKERELLAERLNPDYIPTKDDFIFIDDIEYEILTILNAFYYYKDCDSEYSEKIYILKPID